VLRARDLGLRAGGFLSNLRRKLKEECRSHPSPIVGTGAIQHDEIPRLSMIL
jgi:hypothetical protein